MCFTGRGGEVPVGDGTWRAIDRDEAKRRFRAGEADVLLCSEAAAEGLNFQFCGALVNYDMPWNPMRVKQRIGRIDRLGQAHATIRIFNLHYEDTVEADIYRVLRERIRLFEGVVGELQPILARMSGRIAKVVLAGGAGSAGRSGGGGRTRRAGGGGSGARDRHRRGGGHGRQPAGPAAVAGHDGGPGPRDPLAGADGGGGWR